MTPNYPLNGGQRGINTTDIPVQNGEDVGQVEKSDLALSPCQAVRI